MVRAKGKSSRSHRGTVDASQPEWAVKRVIRMEKRKNTAGNMVNMALLDWEPTWAAFNDLDEKTQALVNCASITVLGPLGGMDEEENAFLDPFEIDWVIEKGEQKQKYSITYPELKSRFYPELMQYYERAARASHKNERLRVEKNRSERSGLLLNKENKVPLTAKMSTESTGTLRGSQDGGSVLHHK